MLNEGGGYESDLTVMHLGEQRFLLITGSAQPIHDSHRIRKLIPADAHCHSSDVTSAWSVLALMGPRSRKLLQQLSSADFSNEAFAFSTVREIDLGYATVLANRMSHIGEIGWELFVPVEFAVGFYGLLHRAADSGRCSRSLLGR